MINKILGTDALWNIVREATNYYNSFPLGEMPLWSLASRGFLFEAFQRGGEEGASEEAIAQKINDVLHVRRAATPAESLAQSFGGKILVFYPNMTMYDGISEQVSGRFFDSDDVPPPELWLFFSEEKLFSLVPNEFLDRADAGIESCPSGCLEWMEGQLPHHYPNLSHD